IIDEEPWRRERLLHLAGFAHKAFYDDAPFGGSQIIPVVLGDAGKTVNLANSLQQAGFDVRAVRPPTVPEGSSRLRISVHADHTESEIEALAGALRAAPVR